ncbi:MAG: hypothetical protein ACKVU2_00910 [Saprospiraceae bacterium]
MKVPFLFRHAFWFFALLLASPSLFGFQLADGASPAPKTTDKYIFYWGSLQVDLTRDNSFRASAKMPVQAFRQMLLRPPHLWNGTALADRIAFHLDGHPLAATRSTNDYISKLGWMDETFSRPAVVGQVLHLTGLTLDDQTTGIIDITLEEPEKKGNSGMNVRSPANKNSLNTHFLKQAIWGREDIHETSNRDFFTVSEFWQTVGQIPVMDWQPHANPVPATASIQINSPEMAAQGFSSVLESEAYLGMLETLRNYKHLAKPGSTVTLTLKTRDQHDPLYEKSLNIVADSDPRLTLRRKRDARTFQIRWGSMDQRVTMLYLLELKDANGNLLTADEPQRQWYSFRKAELEAMLTMKPEFWVDGEPLRSASFRITTPRHSIEVGPDQPMPDSLAADLAFATGTNDLGIVQLHNLRAPGYDLSAIEYSLGTMENPLPLRNTLDVLKIIPVSPLIKLQAPVEIAQSYEVEFDLPAALFVRLSVFESDGWMTYSVGDTYTAGKHRLAIPRGMFRRSGKHFLILNTQIGVARVEFEAR